MESVALLPLPQLSSSEPSPQSSFPSQCFFCETHFLFLHFNSPALQPPSKEKKYVWEMTESSSVLQWHMSAISVSPQFCSSVPSPQSSMPSHFQNLGLHSPFLQVIWSSLHSAGRNSNNDCIYTHSYIQSYRRGPSISPWITAFKYDAETQGNLKIYKMITGEWRVKLSFNWSLECCILTDTWVKLWHVKCMNLWVIALIVIVLMVHCDLTYGRHNTSGSGSRLHSGIKN